MNDSKKRILIVEDDNGLAHVYETRFIAEGYDVKRVVNGEEALSSAMQFRPHLVVLDVMMPRINGFDVLDIIRNTPEVAGVKVIMLTALGQDTDVAQAKAYGADEYLIKSQVTMADVVATVKRVLGE